MTDHSADDRTLTFTIAQLRDMLLMAQFSSPPTSNSLARAELDIRLNEEWHRQQRGRT